MTTETTPRADVPKRRDRGATLPIVAILLPVLLVMTAFAVDLGRQRSSRRTMQARADIIALDMVRIIEGRDVSTIVGADAAATEAALVASAARNEVERAKITSVEWGLFDAAATPQFTPLSLGFPNAVRITTAEDTDYFFQPGSGSVTRSAVATTDAVATGQIGSGLVTVDSRGSVTLDAVLRRAFGINSGVGLGLLNYNGLAGATVGLNQLAAALGAGSPSELASSQVTARDLMLASADVLEDQGDVAAAQVMRWYGTNMSGSSTVDMGQLLQFEQGGPDAAAGAGIDAFGLLTGTAYAINGTNTISVPSVTTNIAGITSTSMALDVIQGPIQWHGAVGAPSKPTQQVGLNLTAQVNLPLSVIGLSGARLTGSIPVHVGVAGAIGTILDIDCSSNPGITLGAEGRPVTVQASLDLDVGATVLFVAQTVATLNTTAVFSPGVAGSAAQFDYPTDFMPEIGSGGMVHGPGVTIGLSQALTVTGTQVTPLGIVPLNLGALSAAINTALKPVLDQLAAYSVTIAAQLGVDIGGSDLAAVDMSCGHVKLVG